MRVLLLTTALGSGGTERYVVDLATGLCRHGVPVCVIADAPPLDRMEILDAAGVETVVLGHDSVSGRQSYTRRLIEALQTFRPDVVHLNVWERRGWIAAALSELKLSAVCTEHNCQRPIRLRDVVGLNRVPFSWYRQVLQALRFPIPTISISNRSLTNLRRRTLGLLRSVRIYNGIPVPAALPQSRLRGNKKVVWAGRMVEGKRPLLAVQAVEHAAAACPGISLVMLGDGPLLQDVRERAKSVRSARIEFRGHTPDVLGEMATADVLLQTSASEGISYAVLEAMSTGLPVVATNVGGTAEAVVDGETGFLVGGRPTAAQVASKLVPILNNSSATVHLGASGFRRCADVFALDRMLGETLQLYSEIAAQEFVPRQSRFHLGAL